MLDDQTAVIVGNQMGDALFRRTTDGGLSWVNQFDTSVIGQDFISRVDEMHAFSGGVHHHGR